MKFSLISDNGLPTFLSILDPKDTPSLHYLDPRLSPWLANQPIDPRLGPWLANQPITLNSVGGNEESFVT